MNKKEFKGLSIIADELAIDEIEKMKRKFPEVSKIFELDIRYEEREKLFQELLKFREREYPDEDNEEDWVTIKDIKKVFGVEG